MCCSFLQHKRSPLFTRFPSGWEVVVVGGRGGCQTKGSPNPPPKPSQVKTVTFDTVALQEPAVRRSACGHKPQHDPRLFAFANHGARNGCTHVQNERTCTVFLLGQMEKNREGKKMRHANICDRKRRNSSECINNHL